MHGLRGGLCSIITFILRADRTWLQKGVQTAHSFGPRDRAGELKLAQGIKSDSYKLSDFKTTRNGPVMVVTYKVNAPEEVIEGKRVADGSHERLAV